MIRMRFKSKEKELEFFKSIDKYNYLNDAGILFAIMLNEDYEVEDCFDCDSAEKYEEL